MTSPNFQELTWGVELEFMASPVVNEAHPKQLVLTRRAIAQKLSLRTKRLNIGYEGVVDADSNHESKHCASCMFEFPNKCESPTYMTSGPAEHVDIRPGTHLWSNIFVVQNEDLKDVAEINQKRGWPAIEICTPVFDKDELLNGMPALSEILSRLRDMDLDITADRSCGLHVHIGNPDGMTLLFAKKMVTLVAILEGPLFHKLCAPHRAQENLFSRPIRTHSCLALHSPAVINPRDIDQMNDHLPPFDDRPGLSITHNPILFTRIFENIWTAPSLSSLSQIVRTPRGKRIGLAISNRTDDGQLCTSKSHIPGAGTTIEFRYLQMTFDKDLIQKWVEILFQVASIARLDAPEFMDYIQNIYRTLNSSPYDEQGWELLLEDILGLEQHTRGWNEQIERYQTQEIAFLDENLLLMPEEVAIQDDDLTVHEAADILLGLSSP